MPFDCSNTPVLSVVVVVVVVVVVPDVDLSWRRASFGNILPVHFSLRSFLGLRITSLVFFWFHHDPQRFYSVGDRKSLSTVNRDLNFKSLLFCSASSLSTP